MVEDLIRNDTVQYQDVKFSVRAFDPGDENEMPPLNMLTECGLWTLNRYGNLRSKLKSPNDAPLAVSTQACQLRVEHRARHLVTTGMAEDMDLETRNTNFRAVIIYLPGVLTHLSLIYDFLFFCASPKSYQSEFTHQRKVFITICCPLQA